jgi:isopentenyl phosphate kinase
MFIIKLGGSVITDKSKENCFKHGIFDKLTEQLKKANKKTIIIHGAGSFGHIIAKKYELNQGFKNKEQLHGFSLTHAMVQKLNSLVLDSFHKNGISAVSIPPHSVLKLRNHKPSKFDNFIFKEYLDMGFIPVTFGDVVLDEKLGFSICSGDLLIQLLAEHFQPEKAVFVIDEDGLFTSNPKIDKNAKLIEEITLNEMLDLTTSLDAHVDVTGGMGGKINAIKNIAELGIETVIVNGNKPDRLYKVLVGEKVKSTNVTGDKL